MVKIAYQHKNFKDASLALIEQASRIVESYAAQGYSMTLRQLYYRLVSKAIIENTIRSYKNLGSLLNDARLAGMIDWDAIEDRTRNLSSVTTWEHPRDILDACARQFKLDPWEEQEHYIEVWVEKEALANVVERASHGLRVPFFCCRGYTSQSEMHEAALRLVRAHKRGKTPVVIHLGDHDPSGIDMSRDITDRFELFHEYHVGEPIVDFTRIALNFDQVEAHKPPPNPAKLTDSRAKGYVARFGYESWELDALEPKVLNGLISDKIGEYLDVEAWERVIDQEARHLTALRHIRDNWEKHANG